MRVTISKTSDGWYRVVVVEKYSTPWYYGETVDQALRGAPVEVRAHSARVAALITHPEVWEAVIKDRGGFVEVECIYGQYRRVLMATSSDLGEALDKALRELEEANR